MHSDRVGGTGKQISGSIKEAAGKVTGDSKTQAEGATEKTAGKAQSALGRAKDKVRDVING